jgi:hypothetical protein
MQYKKIKNKPRPAKLFMYEKLYDDLELTKKKIKIFPSQNLHVELVKF